ncbi:MAG: hypothetical protein IPN00_01285 [Hydrogenophilales bacterium]|jgi:hypothetical protein|nr:hypothetical protein [Hydrogenophilales bacterium]
MKHARSSLPGFLLALGLGMAVLPLASAADNGSPASPPPANGAPPQVATPPGPSLSDLGRSLRSYFTEEELDLLFEYMRDSVIAAFKGEEVTLPPDLSFKLEILLVRMKKEGGHYMDNLIRQLEKDLERNLKEKLKEQMAGPDTSASVQAPPPPLAIVPFFPPPPQQPPAYQPPAYQPPVFQPQDFRPPAYQPPQFPFFSFPFFQPPAPPPVQTDP